MRGVGGVGGVDGVGGLDCRESSHLWPPARVSPIPNRTLCHIRFCHIRFCHIRSATIAYLIFQRSTVIHSSSFPGCQRCLAPTPHLRTAKGIQRKGSGAPYHTPRRGGAPAYGAPGGTIPGALGGGHRPPACNHMSTNPEHQYTSATLAQVRIYK